ncbi:MAG: DUF167 domain-containing protein [Planctomycetia bacterium]|nr:DUF167 domain-containing protein [Planctomycetia bacterium]
MIAMEPHPEGVVLPVRGQPGAKRSAIGGEHNGMLKVAVTQVAEKGKANDAIAEVLRRELSLRGSQLVLLSGETSRQKRFLVRDVTIEELAAKLRPHVDRG